jgi:predicted metalloendopeptidase
VLAGLILSAFAGLAGAESAVPGLAQQNVDPSVRPQDDFYANRNGAWLKSATIPADKSSWGSGAEIRELIQARLRTIIEQAAADTAAAPGSSTRKMGDFYASFMDEQAIEKRGLAPLAPELARIDAINDKRALAGLFAHMGKLGASAPFVVGIHQDAKDSSKYVADLTQSGLGMPDRDYYLKPDDAKLAATRAKYQLHVEHMLALLGEHDAAALAAHVMTLETALASAQWTAVEERDVIKRYNKVALTALDGVTAGFDWPGYLAERGIAGKTEYVIVSEPSYFKALAGVIEQTPLATWKAYLRMRVASAYGDFLTKAMVDERFAFYGTVLKGTPEQPPRWKRGVDTVEEGLGEAVGQVYVNQFFPATSKARMQEMVANLMLAYKQSIDKLPWMSPATRKQAQAKLAKFTPKIGYPDTWRDYSTLAIARVDLAGNMLRLRAFDDAREMGKLGKPIDRAEWIMTPQTVNAYYNPEMNEIVFPAGILQAPLFNPDADDAMNYGAIGAVIGHEISHGFDDQGAEYDGDGNMRSWWSKADHKNFEKKTHALIAQYNRYLPLPGYPINGALTLGENIADNSGVAIAYKAYQLSLKGKKSPVIGGTTGEQRFFMSYAQAWRRKTRDEALIVQIKSDPHSPASFRVNGVVPNQPAFYQQFNVRPGDKMYLAPKDRVIMW